MIKLFSWIAKIICGAALIALAACTLVPNTGGASLATPTSLPSTVAPSAPAPTSMEPSPLPTSASTPEAGPTAAPDGTLVVTLNNDQQTIHLKVGQSFLLKLGDDTFDWTVEIQDQSIVSRVMGVMVIKGAQGLFEGRAPGTTVLQASGDPFCRQSQPACAMPSRLFKLTLVVEQ